MYPLPHLLNKLVLTFPQFCLTVLNITDDKFIA